MLRTLLETLIGLFRTPAARHMVCLQPKVGLTDIPLSSHQKADVEAAIHALRLGPTEIVLFEGSNRARMARTAEAIAGALKRDLLKIDVEAIVSLYAGETGKALDAVFAAAGENGAVILIDEADALFGKRSEVKDAHDRYADIEVGNLLERLASSGSTAILATSRKQALDPAFLRRMRFVIHFP